MVTFQDGTAIIGTSALMGNVATYTTTGLAVGTDTITAVYSGDSNLNGSTGSLLQEVSITGDVDILNPTASGALTVSGNAELTVTGMLQVNSDSSQAVVLSGHAVVDAGAVQIVGGDLISGQARITSTPVTGVSSPGDPLASLATPTGGTNMGSINLSSGTETIDPGIYTSITVSGNGHLILNPGVYIIGSGGITFSGNAIVTGTGIMIYNSGALTASGSASINLTAATSGTYANVAIFQARTDSSVVTVSSNVNLNLNGGILYAANVQCVASDSGNGMIKATLVVNELTVTGNSDTTSP